jgi:hypothetical protein
MQIVVLVAGSLFVVSALAIWRRFGGSRSDVHSIYKHEHALEVLGDTAARSTAPAATHHPPPEEVAKSHIRPTEDDAGSVLRPAHAGEMPHARVRLEPPVPPGLGESSQPPDAHGHRHHPSIASLLRRSGEVVEEGRPTGKLPAVPAAPDAQVATAAQASTAAPAVPAAQVSTAAQAAQVANGTAHPEVDDVRVLTEDGSPAAAGLPAAKPIAPVPAPRRRLVAPPPLPGFEKGRPKGAAVSAPAASESPDADTDASPHVGRSRRLGGHGSRRLTTGVVGLVAVAAVAITASLLAGNGKKNPTTGGGTTNTSLPPATTVGSGSTTTSTPSPTTSTLPATLVPQAANTTDVAYVSPFSSYVVTMMATSNPCWIGVQKVSGGPWVWEGTLQPGQKEVYDASGATIIRVGAPRWLKISIDGIEVQLPASNVQPYDLTFTPSS